MPDRTQQNTPVEDTIARIVATAPPLPQKAVAAWKLAADGAARRARQDAS